eukprot:TRINITY_DN1183_c2_g2_i2.p1 TRINITY_DN1183_c2_g2~~TRINITY_DN1183_c2_g2_i2.p1  ORF type:complete len:105 (+),score=43.37 TRINITY_DN1183_c2_g2_i2:264-578(+)
MVEHLTAHPLFELIPDEELEGDKAAELVMTSSEEAGKVEKSGGSKYRAIFKRIQPTDELFEDQMCEEFVNERHQKAQNGLSFQTEQQTDDKADKDDKDTMEIEQ